MGLVTAWQMLRISKVILLEWDYFWGALGGKKNVGFVYHWRAGSKAPESGQYRGNKPGKLFNVRAAGRLNVFLTGDCERNH